MTPLSVLGLLVPLADKPPDPSQVGQGWIGFVVFLFLAVGTVLLWLSFRRQLKKVDFEEKPERPRRTREERAQERRTRKS
jgi:hypothetical protein